MGTGEGEGEEEGDRGETTIETAGTMGKPVVWNCSN